jgi:hypothetical protein
MQKHYECHHTVEGQQRKIRKQHRLQQVLEANYTVATELFTRFKGHIPNPDKFRAFLDFHIVGITPAFAIVECDEFGHTYGYPVRCELTRMLQVHESLMKSGETRPVVFIRWNPDPFTVDGVTRKTTLIERDAALLKLLEDMQDGSVIFTEPLNIVYMFYDTSNNVPEICDDPDYFDEMKGCVRFL